jgi:predicted kinase
VRGKVDSLTSAEDEVAPAERDAARQRATRHFALAYRYTWAYSPCLVVVAGLSGTGKSAIAAALHTRTGFTHVNSDVIRKELAGLPPDTPRSGPYDTGLYTPEHSARTYEAMFAAAATQLTVRRGVILDATFQRRADRDAARALARSAGVPLLIVECRCADDEVHRRLTRRAARGDSPSDADWNIYREQQRRCEPFAEDERPDHLVLDTSASPTPGIVEADLRRLTN